jgi:ATP-dependent Zn protease
MTERENRSYKTTWAVFLMLVVLVFVVFALTNVNKTPKVKGSLSYEQLIQKVQTSPDEIREVTIINEEPIVIVKLKGDASSKQIVLRPENKATLFQELQKAKIPLKSAPPDKSSFWWEVRMPGFSVGGP